MPSYIAPARDTAFVLNDLLGVGACNATPALEQVDEDLIATVVGEAGRFCAERIAPLNPASDREGCTRHPDGSVTTPSGFPEAYADYVESGWGTLALPEEYGGQGMPHVLATVVEEYLNSSCHAFNMYPGLTHGAVSAIMAVGSEEQKATYLPKLISGEWLGTMALTEAHAGTDLGLLRTKAEKQADGSYRIEGEKIFCSGGEHDLTENIVHLVLARTSGAPSGSRGISLFIVPKIVPDSGERNAVSCNSIEHKMGIHGSATCVMNFDGAIGYLLGEENAGLAAMFVMMNAARLSCGNQGLAQAELAYQNAAAYAIERRQGRAMGERPDPAQAADPLIVHPDIRRMLMEAKAFTEGFRALVAWTAMQIDISHGAADETERREADALVGFLTPVIKAYGTDMGFQTAVAMQQVLGGHGYVSEWGLEQVVRDARVAMIYEGANGVQALDLAGRKVAKDGGAVAGRFFAMLAQECDEAADSLAFIADPLGKAVHHGEAAAKMLADSQPEDMAGGAYAFLQLVGTLAVGLMWLRMAKRARQMLNAGEGDAAFLEAKLATARFHAEQQLPLCSALRHRVKAGGEAMMALAPEDFLNR